MSKRENGKGGAVQSVQNPCGGRVSNTLNSPATARQGRRGQGGRLLRERTKKGEAHYPKSRKESQRGNRRGFLPSLYGYEKQRDNP